MKHIIKLKNHQYLRNMPLLVAVIVLFSACEEQLETADAYGNFEAREVLVASEMPGKLTTLKVEEGQRLKAGDVVAVVDDTQLMLQKKQLLARIQTINGKKQDAQPQISVYQQQKNNLLREKRRLEALVQGNAATQQQLDDLNGKIEVIEKQITAAEAQTQTMNNGIMGEIKPIYAQIDLLEDKMRRCTTYNPIDGTVLLKMAEPSEITGAGKPLYKIADTDNMILRAYVSGTQLPKLKVGQQVAVSVDETATTNRTLQGKITWMAAQAEFTPKIVQTKEERVNLVYAIKIAVKNDGTLKIGMPAEVNFE